MFNGSDDCSSTSQTDPVSNDQLQMYISKGSHVSGVFRIQGAARIDGYVEGEIHADNMVQVGKDGVIVATITAGSLYSQGPVRGDVIVREQVDLLAPATLEGSIQTPVLTLEKGVQVTGNLSMGGS